MKLYVSGPMTGRPDLNRPAFHAAATQLRGAGYAVVNPAELNPEPDKPWEACMRVDIKALMDCDGVALLPGWPESRGATLEVHIALRIGMALGSVGHWIQLANTERAEAVR